MRILPPNEIELQWLEDFTVKVQAASFGAITEKITQGRSADIIISEAKKLASLLGFGDYGQEHK